MDDLDRAYQKHGLTKCGMCKFNKLIDCDMFADCQSCGWNPAVDRRRKAMRRGKEQVPRERWTIGSGPFKDGMECHT